MTSPHTPHGLPRPACHPDSETWRASKQAPNYSASTCGRIARITPTRNGARPVPYLLSYRADEERPSVTVYTEDGPKKVLVHRLVLGAHVGPAPADRPIGSHLNDDATDHHLTNLRWSNHSANSEDETRHGKRQRGSLNPHAALTRAQAGEIRTRYRHGGVTQRCLAKLFGVSLGTVNRVIHNPNY